MGSSVESGEGPLTDAIKRNRETIRRFEVFIEPTRMLVEVDLLEGNIKFDGAEQVNVAISPDAPLGLVWYRRMSKPLFLADQNGEKFSCLFYAVGFERTVRGLKERVEYRIIADGRIARVINT